MAGGSTRFYKEGYSIPKFLIKVEGKSLLEHSVNSLPMDLADGLIFILLKSHEHSFNVSSIIKKSIPHKNIQFVFIDKITRGQAETVYLSKNLVEYDEEIAIYNIDTKFESKSLSKILSSETEKKDGIIGAFNSPGQENHWSFAEIGPSGIIQRTSEKEKISDYALTGFYHFSRSRSFFDVCEKWINQQTLINGELYIAPMYNDLIFKGQEFVIDLVDEFFPLGTPKEVEKYKNEL
tara:strand:- start:11 stop:718 length:708 start_codon:yes stop_codon:yes gene_type:complete